MKLKNIFIILFLFVGKMLFAQNTFPTSGNVGIGTTNPKAKLDLVGNMLLQSVLTNTSPRPSLSTQPLSGEIRAYSAGGYAYDDGLLRLSAGAGTTPAIMSYIDISSYSTVPDINQNIVFGTAGEEKMRIDRNGNIGIGTAIPNEKLTVNGKIRAREIKVEGTNWPDYVFEKNYQIASLGELEKYIKTNKHLPEMPGAKEVESNGVELGNLVKKLLKNQEELTLHLIAQEKIIKAMEKKLNIQHDLKTKSKRK